MPSLQRALANRNYAKLWYGQAVSVIGDTIFGTTLVLWVSQVLAHGLPWAPAAVSGMLVAAGAAVALVGPVAGVFVDRWNRKSTMMRTEVIRAAMVAGLMGLSFIPVRDLPIGLWLAAVYVVVFVLNAAGQFFSPARFATIGDVVHGEEDRARAAGLAEATTSAAGIVGPPIAALLLITVGFQWALAANTASYVVSYLAIRSLRLAPEPHPPAPAAAGVTSLRTEFSAGLRLFARNRFLVTLLTVTMICQCGTGAINALNVFFVTRDLHASSGLFGIAETAMAVGFIVGALAAGRMVRWVGARALTWSGLLATGVLAAGYALQRSFPAGLVMLAIYAVPIAMLNTAVAPLLLEAAPREYLGRVMAVFTPVNQLASMLSVVISGWLASTALRSFRASFAGVTLNSVSLIFVVSGGLIFVSGIRAFAALPGQTSRDSRPAVFGTEGESAAAALSVRLPSAGQRRVRRRAARRLASGPEHSQPAPLGRLRDLAVRARAKRPAAEPVEVPEPRAAEESIPLSPGEPQDRPFRVPAVADADKAAG